MPTISFNVAKKKVIKKETPKTHGFSTVDYKRLCVYAHYYDNEDKPFYIGQGTIARAFSFSKSIRNKLWKNKVKQESLVHIKILNIDITEEESIKIEKELIKKYGLLVNNTGCLTNENNGGKNCQIGKDNYFYNKHFYKENNGNYNNKYSYNSLSIPILQINVLGEIVKEWASATEAEEKGNFIASCINQCCNGKRHIHKWFQWVYKKDYDANKDYEYKPGLTNEKLYILESVYHDLKGNRVIIKAYGSKELTKKGFNRNKVSDVINGRAKTHKGYYCIDFFNSPKEIKEKYIKYLK